MGVRWWRKRKTYPGADAAVAGPGFEILEWGGVEVEGDGAAVAAAAVAFGVASVFQVGDVGAVGGRVWGPDAGAVEGFDFEGRFVEGLEGADLVSRVTFFRAVVLFWELFFLSGGNGLDV